ncbi:MAG: prepilin-type N-terminal cleavage/methylation domain-containing protein [Planctomycetota bacterium]|nr:prepilin-type N-terminal cleavage/methylation domain-containing protein [Planctomycetota bacterium]
MSATRLTSRRVVGFRSAKAIYSRSAKPPCGLSLLEVMLALAILGGALAAIGELMRIGARNAEMARDLTTAQLICESTMAEIQLGFLPLQSIEPVAVSDLQYQQEWRYSIIVSPIDQAGLSSVWVRIEQNPEIFSRPVSFSATRWMIDPSVAALTAESSTTTGGAGG